MTRRRVLTVVSFTAATALSAAALTPAEGTTPTLASAGRQVAAAGTSHRPTLHLERAVPGPAVASKPTAAERALRPYGYLVPHPAAYARAKARADAPSAPSGSGAAAARRAPVQRSNFAGIRGTRGVPSDSTGAVGTRRYMELVNSRFGLYSRTRVLLGEGTLNTLVGAGSSDNVFDPQVIWDPGTARFYYAADDIRASDRHNLLAIGFSKTATPSRASDFCKYVIDYGAVDFPDYPKLGDTENFWVLGVNVFSPNTYTGSDILAISKPAAGTTCPKPTSFGFTRRTDIKNANGSPAFTPVPANQTDPSPTGWVVARPAALPARSLTIFKITRGPTGRAVISRGSSVTVPSYRIPADAPQRGTSKRLDTSDTRNTQAVSAIDPAHGGKLGLWTQHTTFGGAGAEVRWYEIAPFRHTLLQRGRVTDRSVFNFNGAISPDRKVRGRTAAFGGSMVMNFNTSSRVTFPTIKVVSKVRSRHQSRPVTVVRSAGPNVDFSCDSERVCRWGDYAAATPDPAVLATGRRGAVFGTSQYNLDGRARPHAANWLTRNFSFTP